MLLAVVYFILFFENGLDKPFAEACYCGTSPTLTRLIIGGTGAKANEFPWMSLILYKRRLHGGGSLINDKYILTAGHVLHGFAKEKMEVVLGVHNRISMDGQKPKFLKPEAFLIHPLYHEDQYDIGLIRLRDTVIYEKGKIWPICLPPPGKEFYNTFGTIAGWGVQEYQGLPSRTLKKSHVKTITIEECLKTPMKQVVDKIKNLQPRSLFCAIGWHTDACQGDSGGPLMIQMRKSMAIIGLVSSGRGCGNPSYPGIYTNVGYFLQWIQDNTQDAKYCENPLQ